MLLIFQHLNSVELCGLARVCREWREVSEHPMLWRHVVLEDIPLNNMVSMQTVRNIFVKQRGISDFNFLKLFLLFQALQAIARKCSSMQVLKLKGISLPLERIYFLLF